MSQYKRPSLEESWIDVEQARSLSATATNSPFIDADVELMLHTPFYTSPDDNEDYSADEEEEEEEEEEDDNESDDSTMKKANVDLGQSLNTLLTSKTQKLSGVNAVEEFTNKRKDPEELRLVSRQKKPSSPSKTPQPEEVVWPSFELSSAWAAAGLSLVAGLSFGAGYAFGRRSGTLRVQ